MQAFSPASSKVDLVEAAEAHAQKLNQLAINLSGCVAPPGCSLGARPWVQLTSLGGLLEGDHYSRRIQAFCNLIESLGPKFWQKGAGLKGLEQTPEMWPARL